MSCSSKKEVASAGDIKPKSANYLIKKVSFENAEYSTISADLSFDGSFGEMRQRVKGKLRHVRDSVIWISASKFGFEIGRVMITPDSFFLLDRINKEYMAEPIDYVGQLSGIETDFYLLQDLLVGKIEFAKPPLPSTSIRENMYYLVGSSLYSGISLESYLDAIDFSVRQLIYRDYRNRSLKINYLEPGQKGTYLSDRQFETYDPVEGDIDIKLYFEDVEIDSPVQCKFEVPTRYDRI
jgi:hypothetical protein